MGIPQRRTFDQIVREFAPIGAMIILEKARLASAVAKCAISLQSRRAAYRIKDKLLERATDLCSGDLRRVQDRKVRRWRLCFKKWGEIHGDRL